MPAPCQPMMQNKLLALLPSIDYDQIAPDLTHVILPRGRVLAEAGGRIEYIYFLTTGIGSVVATTPEGHCAEAGMFGFDGYVPTSAAARIEFSPHLVNVQADAEAYRMDFDAFYGWMDTNRSLAKIVVRAMEAFAIQVAYTAVSNAAHDISERLARWLLMCHDRLPGNEIRLTHDYLAVMLSVRRPSVTRRYIFSRATVYTF